MSLIKRNGKTIVSEKMGRVNVFKDTLKILSEGKYIVNDHEVNIKESLDNLISKTVLYNDKDIKPTIEVCNEKSFTSATRLLKEGKENIVLLNFASGHSVGGSVIEGANAQEEDLCRCSGLYDSLKTKTEFYESNSKNKIEYTDDIIYSPNVPFFKDDNFNLLEKPIHLSVITSPAPNLMHGFDNEFDLNLLINKRILKILRVAMMNNHKTILLGAWGCGAFQNDRSIVANAFKDNLKLLPFFEHVCFPVFDNQPEAPLYNFFKSILME